jgi:hypothetical protein
VLISFLRKNVSVFVWKPADMLSVPQELIEYSLDVLKTTKPIKQKLRWFLHDKKETIRVEVTRLLVADFIKDLVLVRKKNKEWRMCVDYTDLNKHCPKDSFSLPHIDGVVDSTAGYELLSFQDCYSSYHQISLREEQQIKTSFITPFDAYCYTTMSIQAQERRGDLSKSHPTVPQRPD